VVSDFGCISCQKAEIELQKLYKKYNKKVNFKFVYFSDYIDKSAIACEAAANQDKFKLMHDKIFKNIKVLHQDSLYYHFARDMGMDIEIFSKDMNDDKILKQLMDNKNYLIANNIFTTPTFIVNKKILDHKYSIHYLEDIIIEELNRK
ncbi:MAG: DsbA family protein, partial [bacterium]